MHTAFDSSPLLQGYKDKPESILVHGAKLFIASATGNLSVYRIDQYHPDDASSSKAGESSLSAQSASSLQPHRPLQTEPIQVVKGFARRPIEKLGVIKETNTLVSLSDGHVSLHDLSTLGLQLHLSQTKGALTFAIDTSIQKQVAAKPLDYGPGPLGGMASVRGSRFAPGGLGAASHTFRPGAANNVGSTISGTASRSRAALPDSSSRGWQSASLRGMDAIIKHKEEEKRRAMEGARFGGAATAEGQEGVMTLVTVLAVGMKRKVVFFRWVDGEFWDTREVALAHTPRQLAFPTPTRLFMGYNASEYGVLSLPLASESTVAFMHPAAQSAGARRDVHVQPPTSSTSGPLVDLTAQAADAWGVSDFDLPGTSEPAASNHPGSGVGGLGAAFGGLGGYIGMAGKGKSNVLQMDGGEVLVTRDSGGIFFGPDGKPARRDGIEWPAIPDEVAFAKPYIFAVLPGGSIPSLKQSSAPNANFPVLQIRSASTLIAVQTLSFPPLQSSAGRSSAASWTSPPWVKLLTTSASSKPPVYLVVTPSDRGAQEREGSTVWRLDMHGWGRQIDELVQKGEFEEALALLDSVDEVILEDKMKRRALVQGLYGVFLFSQNKFDEAIEIFTELDMNPAKVLALYPPNVAGDLSRSREDWLPIFGGEDVSRDARAGVSQTGANATSSSPASRGLVQSMTRSKLSALLTGIRPQSMVGDVSAPASPGRSPGPAPSPLKDPRLRSNLASDVDTLDSASIRSYKSSREPRQPHNRSRDAATSPEDVMRRSLDALGRFLADRRRIFKPILESLPHFESKDRMTMSQIKRDSNWLLSLPNKSLNSLEKDELMAVAQTVDTALFKTFLETKPALVGPLCRVENWCEVDQVEELLKERNKYSELIALYGGKEMHGKALQLLKQFSEDEDDEEEKVGPTIRYLQNLGPEFIDLILETSHWVLEQNPKLGMEIFTADMGKVASLPRLEIVADLERFDKNLCAAYLEHIIGVLDEGEPEFHDKLIRLYLRKASQLFDDRSGPEDERRRERSEVMAKLLAFLRSSPQYRPELILGRLPAEEDDRDMFEARALLLGRMGQHEGALGIYVRKLRDLDRAEAYCRDVWSARRRLEEEEGLRRAELGYLGRKANDTPFQQQQRRLQDAAAAATSSASSAPDTPDARREHDAAEEQRRKADEGVFLTLLQIYLRPRTAIGGDLMAAATADSASGQDHKQAWNAAAADGNRDDVQLEAALALIQRNASRIDLIRALELLPPLVSLRSLENFIRLNLRDQTRRENEAKVIGQIRMMRDLQVGETLSRLQSRRVKVGEMRTCPRCHKRLGNSVVAVEPVTGAVLHYFCMLSNGDDASRGTH
ncbi:Vacuolar morphogenesis protein 6 [Thecaphora frezii]